MEALRASIFPLTPGGKWRRFAPPFPPCPPGGGGNEVAAQLIFTKG
jgi:hypothetical protein